MGGGGGGDSERAPGQQPPPLSAHTHPTNPPTKTHLTAPSPKCVPFNPTGAKSMAPLLASLDSMTHKQLVALWAKAAPPTATTKFPLSGCTYGW